MLYVIKSEMRHISSSNFARRPCFCSGHFPLKSHSGQVLKCCSALFVGYKICKQSDSDKLLSINRVLIDQQLKLQWIAKIWALFQGNTTFLLNPFSFHSMGNTFAAQVSFLKTGDKRFLCACFHHPRCTPRPNAWQQRGSGQLWQLGPDQLGVMTEEDKIIW